MDWGFGLGLWLLLLLFWIVMLVLLAGCVIRRFSFFCQPDLDLSQAKSFSPFHSRCPRLVNIPHGGI